MDATLAAVLGGTIPDWFIAVRHGDVAALRAMNNSTLLQRDSDSNTPAHHAAANGHVNVLQCLHKLVPGILSIQGKDGNTPAHDAAVQGQLDALRYLYELVPDTINAQSNYGDTPAHHAAMRSRLDVLRFLNRLGPTILSAQDNGGLTPAHYAAIQGHVDALRCLRQLKPDILTAQDYKFHTPRECALHQGHSAAAGYLQACEDWTPLMLAASDRLPDLTQALLHNRTDPAVERVYEGNPLIALHVALNRPPISWSLAVCPRTVKMLRVAQDSRNDSGGHTKVFSAKFTRSERHALSIGRFRTAS